MRISDWSSDVCSSDLKGAAVHPQHGCDQHSGIGTHRLLGKGAQQQMAAHAVSDHDMRPGMPARPFAVKSGQIGNPNRKIPGMAEKGIVRQPARSTLPRPIEPGNMPPCLMKMGNGFPLFLENIAPTRQEQHRPARSTDRSAEPKSEITSLMRH